MSLDTREAEIKRFWKRVAKGGPDECWEWTGGRKGHGYGQVFFGKKNMRTHRLSWELHHGKPPPRDLYVCHRCDNPPCVNPAHLYIGTQKQNIQEALKKGRLYNHFRDRTHCTRGHELSEENTAIKTDGRGNPYRECVTCRRVSQARTVAKNRDLINARKRARRAQARAARANAL